MAQPAQFARVIAFVIALFDNHWEACTDQALEKFWFSPHPHHRLHTRLTLHEIFHFVRHYIFIFPSIPATYSRLHIGSDLIPIPFPAPEIQRHSQICRSAVVPTVMLIYVVKSFKLDELGDRR